ncbi:pyridoxine/pyridoxamine 5'-phosphate oxidase, partial [Xanthovirga aplysinae]|uniref:pyridoxine/pyridoxamine 5'-phosphate oxidase n=1 Tax=Xanthovirga aplysinae TaxID=2529853 RepID=UPI0012BB7786
MQCKKTNKKMNPISLFEKWFSKEKELSNLKLPDACCLSTNGLDGYPNSRFVSLKEITNESFVITGSLNSRKGIEIKNNSKAALSFWWTFTERQIRIQGDVSKISKSDAEIYFKQRSRDSKIVSAAFEQGQEIQDIPDMQKHFEEKKVELENIEIVRPNNWGGFYIKPIRIEFMEFRKSRLHERKLFEQV